MALAPLTDATKPIKSKGLFDASAAGGVSYEDWAKKAQGGAMPSIAPSQVNDSVVDEVNKITSQDSALMQAAKTEGLKVANSRGLLNSSIAAGAAQDATLKYAMPLASQEASQNFERNANARNFEYGMASQDSAQGFQSAENTLSRGLEERMQGASIAAADRQQIRAIASNEGMAAAERAFRDKLQTQQNEFAAGQAGLDRGFQSSENALSRSFQEKMAGLDRGLQEKIASWNLASTDRNAAANFVSNMESIYQNQYASIMANTNLSAEDRSMYLSAARGLRDQQLNLVEQMYDVDLNWGAAPAGTTTTTTAPPGPTSATPNNDGLLYGSPL